MTEDLLAGLGLKDSDYYYVGGEEIKLKEPKTFLFRDRDSEDWKEGELVRVRGNADYPYMTTSNVYMKCKPVEKESNLPLIGKLVQETTAETKVRELLASLGKSDLEYRVNKENRDEFFFLENVQIEVSDDKVHWDKEYLKAYKPKEHYPIIGEHVNYKYARYIDRGEGVSVIGSLKDAANKAVEDATPVPEEEAVEYLPTEEEVNTVVDRILAQVKTYFTVYRASILCKGGVYDFVYKEELMDEDMYPATYTRVVSKLRGILGAEAAVFTQIETGEVYITVVIYNALEKPMPSIGRD